MTIFIYEFLATAAIVSAILVITTNNPVVSVLYLIAVFVSSACYLILIGVSFIGLSYIVVYVGAIAVLMLFVIMMLNIRLSEISATSNVYTKNLPVSALLGFSMLYQLLSVLPGYNSSNSSMLLGAISQTTLTVNTDSDLYNTYDTGIYSIYNNILPEFTMSTTIGLQVQSIGTILYTVTPIWLVLVSIILLLAIVAPIVLSRDSRA